MLNDLINSFLRVPLPNNFIEKHQLLYDPATHLHLICCEYNQQNFDLDLYAKMSIEMPLFLKNLPKKRQSEYLAGRYAAKMALSLLRKKECLEQVTTGPHKEPVFPKDTNGALTHSHRIAVCAVMPSNSKSFLGVDIEPIITSEDLCVLQHRVYALEELKLLVNLGLSPELAATVLFSAKESLYKSLSSLINGGICFDLFELKIAKKIGASLILYFNVLDEHFASYIMVSAKNYKNHVLTLALN